MAPRYFRPAAPVLSKKTRFFSSRRPIASAVASALAAMSGGAVADVILPDGRTGTTVSTLGAGYSEITTTSLRGSSAFNSFSDFQLDAGNTVNFILPSGASRLINLVTDSQAVINGTVNSDGHLVFADPHGIVVGASGVLNVGSLLLTAPSQGLMDALLREVDGQWELDEGSLAQLLAGDGTQVGDISMNGVVNALGDVLLAGQMVVLGGEIQAGTDAAHQALFRTAVNTTGIAAGRHGSVVDGRITIRAGGDVVLSGTADVSAASGSSQGEAISIQAAGNVTLTSTAVLAARGSSDGGNAGRISLDAGMGATFHAGATLDLSASGGGDGGKLELSRAFAAADIEGANLLLGGGPEGNAGTVNGEILTDPLIEAEPEAGAEAEPASEFEGGTEESAEGNAVDGTEGSTEDGTGDGTEGSVDDDTDDASEADSPPVMSMMGIAATDDVITPDNRTATVVTLLGSGVSEITTETVMGASAFNSFTRFEVASGSVVNFILPGSTDKLINLVTDAQVLINGTVQSFLAGQRDRIGGHIVFADPHGIVVGASGVLNVGSVLLSTPTRTFMDSLLSLVDSAPVINEDAALILLHGDAALSVGNGAVVQIEGVVNAYGVVALESENLILTGSVNAGSNSAHAALGGSAPVIDGRVSLRAESDVTVSGVADASSAAGGGSAGSVTIAAGKNVDIQSTAQLLAIGAADGGNGGRIELDASGNITIAGELDASASQAGRGGSIDVHAKQDLSLAAASRLSVAGGTTSGNAGAIMLRADGTTSLGADAVLDASAGGSGDGGQIKLTGTSAAISGLSVNLAGAGSGADGELLVSAINVNLGDNPYAYYTNGGDVTINAGNSLVIEGNVTINTRRIDADKGAVTITPAYVASNNPANLENAEKADLYTTASQGNSGNVLLQAPHITVKSGARIYTFATDGYDGGSIQLLSGDNVTCNICSETDPGDYFSSVSNVANTVHVSSTDDVSITIESGVTMDARYVKRGEDYDEANGSGEGGDITLLAEASDKQLAGWSNAGASVTVDSSLKGKNVSIEAKADASVNFAWLAGLDPADPTSYIGVLEEISSIEFDEIHQNVGENVDDLGDLSNLMGIGLPVTAGLAQANSSVVVGSGADIEAVNEVTISATANRAVAGATGGLLASALPNLGIGAIYGEVSGTTSATVSSGASIKAGTLSVIAESYNEMEIGAEAQVEASKESGAKDNQTAAFSLAIGLASVENEATIEYGVILAAPDGDTMSVEVRASNLDNFTTEASSVAITEAGKTDSSSQGAMTVAFSQWNTSSTAEFDADVPASGNLDNLAVVADNISTGRVTKATVKTGNDAFDYMMGSKTDRKTALDGLVGDGYSKSGQGAKFRLAAAAAVTISDQSATARIGSNAKVDAAGDVSVISRVVNQGVRSIADSRVNSSAGSDSAKVAGSVGVAVGVYNHHSNAIIEGGAEIAAEHVGVGSRVELPVDNDYDEVFGGFDVTEWEGVGDFLGALNTIVGLVTEGPDAMELENFGLADHLLTSYANSYGDAAEGGTSVFGSANATIVNQNSRAWIGEGARITAHGADEEWESEIAFNFEGPDGDDHDLDAEHTWTWSAAVDVDARSKAETISVVGNLSLLTIAANTKKPDGKSAGGSVGWTEFGGATIAGIADGALVRSSSLDVEAHSDHRMYVVAPSAGHGDSIAGAGIFSLAQMDTSTHASISNKARIEAASIDLLASHDVAQWSIGGAVAVSSGTSIGVAVAVNDIETDTRAWIGDNSADRPAGAAATATVPGGEDAGILTGSLQVTARSEGEVGAIAVAGAVARTGNKVGQDGKAQDEGSKQDAKTQPAPSAPTTKAVESGSLTDALKLAGLPLSGSGSDGDSSGNPGESKNSPPGSKSSLTGAGSGTLNFSKMNTIAEVRDVNFLHTATDPETGLQIRALVDVDQYSASGAAAISLSGGDSSGRTVGVAGAVAFNEIDNTTRAGLYDSKATGGGQMGDVEVLAASSGDALSIGIALSATKSDSSSVSAALSASIGTISIDTTAEIVDSNLVADPASTLGVTAYDRSRILAGGGALSLNLGKGSGAGVGMAATYGAIDNDVSAYIRGSTLTAFDRVDVNALGASRILAGAFGGSVSSGKSVSGAGSLYVMRLDGDINAGITGSYGSKVEDGATVADYTNLLARSNVEGAKGVTVSARSSNGLDALATQMDALFDSEDERKDLFSGESALGEIDADQVGFDPLAGGLAGEALLGFAGSLSISGGNSAAGFAIGFADLGGSYIAEIRDADVEADSGTVKVEAINSRQVVGVAAGASVSGSGQFSALGSGAITLSDTEVKAQILGASKIVADTVDVYAQAEGVVISVAGALSASSSGSAAVGAAVTYNDLGGEVTARIGGTSLVTADGTLGSGAEDRKRSVNVQADQDQDIYSVAVAAAAVGSGTVALAGSASLNTLTTTTSAILDAKSVTADSVQVLVNNGSLADRTSIWSLAGSVTASSKAGFGVALAFNDLAATYDAKMSGVTLVGTEDVRVNSSGASAIRTLAASGGGSGQISAGVSDASSLINNKIGAYADYVQLNNTKARVEVGASDDSSIGSLAGAVQVGGTGGVGIAAAVNSIGNELKAEVNGGTLRVENLLVDAATRAEIQTITAGIAVGGSAGLAGSISVNLLDTSTLASIGKGANIVAENNVGVNATSEDSIDVIAGAVGIGGSGVGAGASVVINDITSSTKAGISGTTTKVSAQAKDAGDTLKVRTGELVVTPNMNRLEQAADFTPFSLTGVTKDVTGVAVNAQSLQSLGVLAVTVGVDPSLIGVALTATTNIVGGETAAYVDRASINTAAGANARQDLDINASSHAYTGNMALGLAVGGTGAGTATAAADVVSRTTRAYASGANLNAKDAVNLNARTTMGTSMLTVGGAAGGVGAGAGSGSIVLHEATTLAYLDGGTDVTAKSLAVKAEADNAMTLASGAIAGAGGGAVAAAVDVAVSSLTTEATITDTYRDGSSGGNTAQIDVSGAVVVAADSSGAINSWAIGGAGAGGVGVGGSIAVNVLQNTTIAKVEGAAIGGLAMNGKVDIHASDLSTVNSYSGALGGGGIAGVGAGVHVSVVHGTVNALLKDSTVQTNGALSVKADSSTEVESVVATVGVGGTAGIAGAISVAVVGNGSRTVDTGQEGESPQDADDEIGGSVGEADSLAGSSGAGSRTGTANDKLDAGQRDRINNSSTFDLLAATDEGLADTTSAIISGGEVSAGSIEVLADDATHLSSTTGALAAGTVGVGGAFTVDRVYNTVNAGIIDDATVIAPGNIKVEALARDGSGSAIDTQAYAGAAGFVGVGAAMTDGRIDNVVTALVDARVQDNMDIDLADIGSNTLVVSAKDTTTVQSTAFGAAVGIGAAGIVVANAGKTSAVNAGIEDSEVVENRAITVSALSQGGLHASATGGAAGAIAISGTVATAVDETEVNASVSDSALELSGYGLKLLASATPKTDAKALGVSAGAYGIGASVALAQSASTVDAVLGYNNTLSGSGNVEVRADVLPTGSTDSTRAEARGATGGWLLGANATVAEAVSTTKVNASVLSWTEFGMDGAISVSASNTTRQSADADSFTVGLVAVGANLSTAKSTGTTTAYFDGRISGAAVDRNLAIRALGNASNSTRSEAGSGGIIAGAASWAQNTDASTVTATLGSDTYLRVGDFTLSAEHTSNVRSDVNSVQASLVGMSGAWASSDIQANVSAVVEDDSKLDADNIEITARGTARKADHGYSVVSGSGGAFNAAAARSTITTLLNTKVDIGKRAELGVVGSYKTPGVFNVLAENVLNIHDSVKLDAGGAIAVAGAKSISNSTVNSTIDIGNAAVLESVGGLNLGTRTVAVVKTKANAKTYGAAGAASGESRSAVNAAHVINVGSNAQLHAYGDARLTAGRDTSGAESIFDLNARTDLWNKTAFPVKTDPDADALLTQKGNINIASGAKVASVADIYFTADKGNVTLTGKGVGKDLYREVLAAIANAFGKLVGAGDLSLDIHAGSAVNNSSTNVTVDGEARAGVYNHQYLTINYEEADTTVDGEVFTGFQIIVDEQSEGVNFTMQEDTYSQLMLDRLTELYKRKSDYGASPIEVAAFQSEINLIEDQLIELGRQVGLTDADMFYYEYADGVGTRRVSVPSIFPILVIQLDDIIARPGNVVVQADNLLGSGKLDAPGDASIVITNNSPAFLRTGDLTIPNREGGQVTLNRSLVHNSADINAINVLSGGASFAEVNTALTSDAPIIKVVNAFQPADLPGMLAPDLYVSGDVHNRRGSVELRSNEGSVIIGGDVRANSVDIGAGENVVLGYIDSFRHIGTDPSGISTPDPAAITVAGNSLIVSARYINVNGVLQSGIPDWTVDVDHTASQSMANALANYLAGGPRVVRIAESNPLRGSIGYRYDAGDDRIIVDAVEVAGGYMELTGKIMSTGNGEIRVLDGYGKVKVNNSTGRTLDISSIDLGSEIEGRLRINDAGYYDGEDDNKLTSTIYTRVGNNVQVYRGAFSELKTTADYLVSDTTGRSASYDPRTGLDYIWLNAASNENKETTVTYKDKAIGFIPSGSGSQYSHTIETLSSAPVDASDYLGSGMIAGKFGSRNTGQTYDWGVQSITTDADYEGSNVRSNWSSCVSRFLGICVEKRAWQKDINTYGTIEIHRYGMKADNQIAISFIGHDEGSADITSLGDIVFSGSLLNASGQTVITSSAGSISMSNPDAVIEANDLNLDGKQGIGNRGALRVTVGNKLNADAGGDISIHGVQGDLHVGHVVATDNGSVTVSAQGNLTASGRIAGNAITLEARQGAIGSADSLLNIDTGDNDTTSVLNAFAPQGVYLNEISGDLRVHTVDAAANNVTIHVRDGALLDANTTAILDERLDAEIQALWDGMDLVGAGADAALAQELISQERAGQSRYDRYWSLRNLVTEFDSAGNVTGYDMDAYDEGYAFQYSAAQSNALALAYGWDTAEARNAGIAELEALVSDEYHALHAEFGAVAAYDAGFVYVLSDAQEAALSEGHAWTSEQLSFSISRGLVNAPGASTGIYNEPENIIGRDIVIVAQSIGKTLDETIVIDLSDGVRALTADERRALATAEYDDIAFDPSTPDIITIVQRDDVDLRASGSITAIVDFNAFIGGEQDLNLYNVAGDAIRIKTDGSITTARVGETVLSGTDVILEGSNGDIGTAAAPLGTAITGELTARTNGEIHIDQSGDLLLDRVFGGEGVHLDVSGNLLAARSEGAAITGGLIDLNVTGNVGSSDQAINVALGLNQQLDATVGGDAWLGAEQGMSLFAGNLDIGDLSVDGRLYIADTTDLLLSGTSILGGLNLDVLGNWTIADGASLTSSGSVNGVVKAVAGLRDIHLSNGADFTLQAARIEALGTGFHLDVDGAVDIDTSGDIAAWNAPLNLAGFSVDATSLSGDVYLNFMRDTQAGGNIAAIEGAVVVDGEENLTLDTVFAADRVDADDVAGTLTIRDSVRSDGAIELRAHALDIATLVAGSSATLTTVAGIVLDSSSSVNDTTLTAGTDASIGSATSTAGNLYLNATGALVADTLNATDILVEAGSADISIATARNSIDIDTVADQVLGSLDAANSIFLQAGGNITLDSGLAGALFEVDAAGKFSATTLNATDILVAAGSADIITATASDSIDITTVTDQVLGSLLSVNDTTLTAGTDIELDNATSTAGNIFLETGGDVLALDLAAALNVEALVGGNLSSTNIAATDILLEADSVNIDFMQARSDIRVETVGDQNYLDMEAIDLIELIAGGNIIFRDMRVGPPDAERGTHGDVLLDAGADIAGNLIDANRDVGVSALGSFRVNELARGGSLDLSAGRNIFARVGGDITDIKIEAGNDVELHALGLDEDTNGDILLESLKAGGHIVLNAAGDIRIQPVADAGGFVEAGGGADFTAAGDIEVDRMTLGGSLSMDASNIQVDEIETGGDQLFNAGNQLELGTLVAGGNIIGNSGGITLIDQVQARGDTSFSAQGALTIDSINSGANVDIKGSRDVDITTISSGGDQLLEVGDQLRLVSLDAGGDIHSSSGGTTTVEDVLSGGSTSFTAGSTLRASTIESGADTRLNGARDISVDSISSGGNQLLQAATTLDLGLLVAGGDITASSGAASLIGPVTSGGSARFTSGAELDIDSISSGASVQLDAISTLTTGDISSGAELLVSGQSDIDIGSVTSGASVQLDAISTLTTADISSGAELLVSGQSAIDIGSVSSGGQVVFNGSETIRIDDVHSGSYLHFTAGGDLTLGSLQADGIYEQPMGLPVDEDALLQHGVAIALDAGNNLRFGNVLAAGDVVTRSGAMTNAADLDLLGNALFLAGTDIQVGALQAGGNVEAEGFNLHFATIDAAGDVLLKSLGDTFVFSVGSLGNQEFRSLGDIDFDALLAGGYIDSVSGGDTRIGSADSAVALAMNAGMEWSGVDFEFTGNVLPESGDLLLDSAVAPWMMLRAGNRIEAAQLRVAESLDFHAHSVRATIEDSDAGNLAIKVTGGNGGLADRVGLDIATDGTLQFATLHSREAAIETNSSEVVANDAWISELLTLQSGELNMLVNQVDRTAQPVDVQLYEADHRFEFAIDGMEITTDAYVVHYAAGFRTWVPNYLQSREEQELLVQGPSAEKYSNTVLTQNNGNTRYVGLANALQFPALPTFGAPVLQIPLLDEGAPVNLGEEEEEES